MPGFAQTHVANLTATQPTFVALDTRGGTTWLYVAEHGAGTGTPPAGGGRILRYNLTTNAAAPEVVAVRGEANGQFISPDGILVDSATGDLFIADRWQNRVQRITPLAGGGNTFVMSFGASTGAQEMHGPVGLARDTAGAIYVAEHGDINTGTGRGFVSKYTISGTTATRVFRNAGTLGFNTPYGIAVSGSTLLVSDGFFSRIQTWDLSGNSTGSFSVGGDIPLGLSVDSAGTLWVAVSSDNGGGTVQQIERRTIAGATAAPAFGTPGSANGQFSLPFHAVFNSATNRAYVADYGNNRVQVFDMATAPAGTAPSITSATTASGTVGTAFSYSITASGTPTSYAASPLPAGLSVNTSTGVISGTPTAAGTTTTTISATNANGTGTATLTITVAASSGGGGGGGGGTITQGPSISSMTLAGGNSSSGTFTVTFSEAVTGVTADDFVIYGAGGTSGTVTGVTGSGTTYTVAFNYFGATGSLQLAIRTSGTGITSTANGAAYVGVGTTASAPVPNNSSPVTAPPTATITAGTVGGSSVNFTVTFSAAVSTVGAADFTVLQSTGVGATVGTVAAAGNTYTVPVNFTGTGSVQLLLPGGATTDNIDAAGNVMAQSAISGSVNVAGSGGGGSAPVISSATSASGTVGTAFTYTITASNSPTSFAATGLAGTGLAINTTTGVISGTPTAAGTITSNISATNASGTGNATLTITVAASGGGGAAPAVTSSGTASATVGTAFTYTITGSNSPTSFAATGLTGTGLAVNTSTGVISGTPTAAGTITSTISATNASGTGNATLTITVAAAGTAPSVTSSTTANGTVGTAFSYSITASGSPTSYNATPLPAGLTVNTATGVISGTPTAAGTTNTTLSATNASGTGTRALTITIAASGGGGGGSAPSISSAGTASATVGTSFSYSITASGSPTSYNATPLPAGLSINTSTGVISGTPTAAGTTNTTLSATNASGTGTRALTITVSAAGTAPTITSATTASGYTGSAFSYSITASGSPTSYSATNLAGTGLSLNTSTGVISGTPGVVGPINTTITATNAFGSANANLTITVAAGPAPTAAPTIANQSVSGTASRFLDHQLVATGNATFSLEAGSELPYALSLSSSGRLAGIPTAAGTWTVTVKATNSLGSATAQVTINVSAPPPPPPSAPAKTSQTITFVSPVSAIRVGTPIQLGATASSGLPITYSVVSGSATINGSTLTPNSTAALTVRASQAGNATYAAATTDVNFGSPEKSSQVITVTTPSVVLTTDSAIALTGSSSSGLPITYSVVSGPAIVNGSTIIPTGDVGIVVLKASQAGNASFNAAADVTVWIPIRASATSGKVFGRGNEVGVDIVHSNGNIYDQVLLTGDHATITADNSQVTRISFLDMNDDIVQVEFSGAGSLSLTLENASAAPVAPIKYNQSGIMYMKGHASIKISGANETTNVSVFSVGKATAVNQNLFPAGMAYDGIADIGLIEISSTNGKFGGVRTANAGYFRASGMTGISAPGVTFTGPVYVGDIDAGSTATGTLFLGSAPEVRITGGNLLQQNSRAILVNGITQLTFAAGTKSDGTTLVQQTNQARFEGSNGLDMTSQIVR